MVGLADGMVPEQGEAAVIGVVAPWALLALVPWVAVRAGLAVLVSLAPLEHQDVQLHRYPLSAWLLQSLVGWVWSVASVAQH